MNKAKLIEDVASKTHLTKKQVEDVIETSGLLYGGIATIKSLDGSLNFPEDDSSVNS